MLKDTRFQLIIYFSVASGVEIANVRICVADEKEFVL
jgi:hypothetical protein